MDVGTTNRISGSAMLASSSNPVIDPEEWVGMAVGGLVVGILGAAIGGILAGGHMPQALRGTREMDAALIRGAAQGGLGGALAGVVGGFLVGHVQNEGWTMPGQ